MRRVTLEDIAKKVGVSKNTVSKALRNADGVSDNMKDKIRQVAIDMGYDKVKNKTIENIVLLCREDFFKETTFWADILYGVEKAARKQNIKLSTAAISLRAEESLEIPYAINRNETDGIIIMGTLKNEFIKKIQTTGIPTIIIDHYSEDISSDYVNSANGWGIYKALEYLYGLGHKKIGFIGNDKWAYSFKKRYDAFIYYASRFNFELDGRYIWLDAVPNGADFIDNTDYFKGKIKYSSDFPSAWVCSNDKIAIAFMRELMSLGVKVPDDVSVVGFDNIDIAGIVHPPLTTIDVPKKALGKRALNQLVFRASNMTEPYEFVELETELITRGSCSKYKSKSENRNL